MNVTIMQGDSYPILISVKQDGITLTPDLVEDVEVSVGVGLKKTYSEGGVGYDAASGNWYIRPTQEETLEFVPGAYDVIVRVKYMNQPWYDVVGTKAGSLIVRRSNSKEVL